jgi:ubiquinone/menaquinone biosynthesis C-methylase UbiE
MDDPAQILAYARADFADSNSAFVRDVVALHGSSTDAILDLGCGPGHIAIQIAAQVPGAKVVALDASNTMLAFARASVSNAGVSDRVQLVHARLPELPFRRCSFGSIVCKDMLHHLPTPSLLWEQVKRLARPGTALCLMDLIRPPSRADAQQIVSQVAAREHPLLQSDFFNSLCAAFTLDEVRAQLQDAGLSLRVEQISHRHLRVSGRISSA